MESGEQELEPLLRAAARKRHRAEAEPSYSAWRVAVVVLILGALGVHRLATRWTLAAEEQTGPTSLVLLTAHQGGKFSLLEPFFEQNKLSFAAANNHTLFAVEAMAEDPRFLPSLRAERTPVLKSGQFKYAAAKSLLERFPEVSWVVWVDGDSWLSPRPLDLSLETRLESASGPASFLVGAERDTSPLDGCFASNAGAWAVRNDEAGRRILEALARDGDGAYDDQCRIAALRDTPLGARLRIVPSVETGSLLQCRSAYKCESFFPDLCCKEDSWNLHLANSDWKDLALGLVEKAGEEAWGVLDSSLASTVRALQPVARSEPQSLLETGLSCSVGPQQWARLGFVVGFEAVVLAAAFALATPSAEESPRLRAIDGLRSFLVVLVLIFHAVGNFESWPEPFHGIFAKGFPVMALFFALSGFVAARSQLGPWTVGGVARVYAKRTLHLGLPYWVVVGTSLMSQRGSVPEDVFMYTWLIAMAGLQAWLPLAACGASSVFLHDGPAWFVSALVPCLFLFPLIDASAQKAPRLVCGGVAAVLCLLRTFPAFVEQSGGGWREPLALFTSPALHLLEFAAGVLVAKLELPRAVPQRGPLTDLCFVALLATLEFNAPATPMSRFGPLDGLFLLVGCCLLLLLAAGEGWLAMLLGAPPLARWFAVVSYEVFLVHVPLVGLLAFRGILPGDALARVVAVTVASLVVAVPAVVIRLPITVLLSQKLQLDAPRKKPPPLGYADRWAAIDRPCPER